MYLNFVSFFYGGLVVGVGGLGLFLLILFVYGYPIISNCTFFSESVHLLAVRSKLTSGAVASVCGSQSNFV